MSDEKRFPPPGNEVGYREAAPVVVIDAPAHAESPEKRHVVGTLAESPEMARNHAAIEEAAAIDALRRAAIARDARRGRLLQIVAVSAAATMLVASVVITTLLRRRSDGLIEAKRQVVLGRTAKYVCTAIPIARTRARTAR